MSVIEAYQKNQKLKEIIDRQEHQYYFHDDTKTNQQQQEIPTVFKQVSAYSQLPEKAQHLARSVIPLKEQIYAYNVIPYSARHPVIQQRK